MLAIYSLDCQLYRSKPKEYLSAQREGKVHQGPPEWQGKLPVCRLPVFAFVCGGRRYHHHHHHRMCLCVCECERRQDHLTSFQYVFDVDRDCVFFCFIYFLLVSFAIERARCTRKRGPFCLVSSVFFARCVPLLCWP